MNLTNEQLEKILDGAPEGETHINLDDGRYGDYGDFTKCLSDLREILTLRQRVQNLETVANASMGVSGQVKDEASKLGFNPASEDDPLSYLIRLAKQSRMEQAEVAARAVEDAKRKISLLFDPEIAEPYENCNGEVEGLSVPIGLVTELRGLFRETTPEDLAEVEKFNRYLASEYANQLRENSNAQEK